MTRRPTVSWTDWWFRDRHTGERVIAQPPNLALGVFLAAALARLIIADGAWHDAFTFVSLGAIGWWALDEIVRGVNPWRRLLGVIGLAFGIAGLVNFVT